MNSFMLSEKLVRAIDSKQQARKLAYALVYGLNVPELAEFERMLKKHKLRWNKLREIDAEQRHYYTVLVYRCDNLLEALFEVRQEK